MYKSPVIQSTDFGMNTEITHMIDGENAQEAYTAGKTEFIRLENTLSRYKPESEISRINQSAGKKKENLSHDAYEILSRAFELSQVCLGLFDVTIGPFVDLWDYKFATEVPEHTRIQQVLPLVNYHDLLLDAHKKSAKLRNPGQSIDLGGIGKGFASDRFMELFKKYDIKSAYTNIGGNVSTLGNKPDGSLWRVGIRHPREEGHLIGAVSVTGKAVVTSGDYERYFIDREGKRRHHILNPATGYPAESGLISVTVVADSAMTADALSTGIFVAGRKKGLDILRAFPDIEAVLVDTELRVYITPGLKECFQAASGICVNLINERIYGL